MSELYVQLNFGGNCQEAFEFYAKHLGGAVTAMVRREDAPGPDPGGGAPEAIIHARMRLGGTELIGNDVAAERFQPIRSSYLYFSVESAEEAERIYGLLSEGGQAYMPLQETFFAHRFAMLRDRFGVAWTVIAPKPMPSR
ncbi:MAG TPA: VOC family protein [Acidobacteriaceae bacterium]|jgi:PhnB protein|nr:VOC family protein [Acidobacteriaceae bacterium]